MLRKLLLAGVVAGACASVPVYFEQNPQALETILRDDSGKDPHESVLIAAKALPQAGETAADAAGGRRVRIEADERGHFRAEFRLNGRAVPAMVDTGATVVAINRSTARRIGLSFSATDFSVPVDTANGRTSAASATIGRLEIGRIELHDIPALVLDDEALAGALVGMSFLGRLRRLELEKGTLLLEQ